MKPSFETYKAWQARSKPIKKSSKANAAKNRAYQALVSLDGPCLSCGEVKATNRHHIYAQSQKPFLDQEPLNILAVCRSCHDKAHENMDKFRERLRQTMPTRMDELDAMAETLGKVNQARMLGR